ncbi:hypothetical protein VP01_8147g1, partial [Puccinia sorghi]
MTLCQSIKTVLPPFKLELNISSVLIPMEAKLHKIHALNIVTGKLSLHPMKRLKKKPIIANMVSADRFNTFTLWQILKTKYARADLTARSVALDVFLNMAFLTLNTLQKELSQLPA